MTTDDSGFQVLNVKLDLIIERQTDIKRQVEKTNGRVCSLESWRAVTVGGLAVITGLVIPMFVAWFNHNLR